MDPLACRAWTIAMAAATIVVLGVWVVIGRHAPAESEQTANLGDHGTRTTADISEVPLETTSEVPPEATPPEGSPPLGLAEIHNICPLFSGDFEDDCMQALDVRYLDRPATYYERPPIFGVRDYTWRDWLPQTPRGRRADFDQNRPLRAAAARLGNEWAMAFHGGSRKDLDALVRVRPDLAYAKRARVVGQNSAKYLPYLTLARDYALDRGLPLDEVESSLGLDGFSGEELERAEKRAVEIRRGGSARE